MTARMLAQRPEIGAGRVPGRGSGQGPGAACALQPLHAAAGRGRARARRRARGARRTIHPSHVDRADRDDLPLAREQREQRDRAELRAPLLPERHSRRPQDEGEDRRVLLRAARLPRARPMRRLRPAAKGHTRWPGYFVTADDVTPKQHVDVQAAAQRWIDSSISKTANVPTDYPYQDFKDIYLHAFERNLKGCTTFRFNPAAFQGVLVKEEDLESTTYRFSKTERSSRPRVMKRSSTTATSTPPRTSTTQSRRGITASSDPAPGAAALPNGGCRCVNRRHDGRRRRIPGLYEPCLHRWAMELGQSIRAIACSGAGGASCGSVESAPATPLRAAPDRGVEQAPDKSRRRASRPVAPSSAYPSRKG